MEFKQGEEGRERREGEAERRERMGEREGGTEKQRETVTEVETTWKRGQDRQRFQLVILVVTLGLIFVDVVLVIVEVAAWSSSKGRRGGRGGR